MRSITTRSQSLTVGDPELGVSILRSNSFGVDHPFRATRQIFGPSVLDTEGAIHIDRKRAWMAEFLPARVAAAPIRDVISRATEAGFALAKQEQDLLAAARYIPNKVLLSLMGQDEVDPIAHFENLRPITEYLETNQRSEAVAKARDYLRSGQFDGETTGMFGALAPEARPNEALLFSYAAAETTMVAMKCLILYWATHNAEFQDRINREGVTQFLARNLRNDPPLGVATRYCKADVEIGGVAFEKGDIVHVNIVDVNNGCPVGDNSRGGSDLTFGAGKHSCPGHLLAKAELEAVVEKLQDLDVSAYEVQGTHSAARPMNFRDPGDLAVRPRKQSAA